MTSKDSPETRTQESEKDQEHSKQDENQGQSHRLSSPKSLSSESQSEQKEETTPVESDSSVSFASQWQAIWSPQYNMYYFYNLVTHETTWANPLQSEAGSSSVAAPANQIAPFGAGNTEEDAGTISSAGPTDSAATSQYAALQAAAIAQGIDPLLAHLDPSLRASMQGPSSVPGGMPLILILQLQPVLPPCFQKCQRLLPNLMRTLASLLHLHPGRPAISLSMNE